MHTINHEFSDQEIKNIENYRDNQTDTRLKARFYAILMIANGAGLELISTIIGKSVKTIENWYNKYINEGIASLNSFQYQAEKTFIDENQLKQLIEWVKETTPSNTKAVREYIKDQFGVICSYEAVRTLMRKNGLRYQKPKTIPGKAPSVEEPKKPLRNILN